MELKQKQVLITIWILGNPECQRSVVDLLNITKLILFCVYRTICRAITNSLSSQYLTYLLVYNWAPLGKMINFGSFAQGNALDQWSVFRSHRSVIRWIHVQSGFDTDLEMDLLEKNATDQKSWSGFSQRNAPLMSITARTEKVKTCIYLPRFSSDNGRLHQGVLQVG